MASTTRARGRRRAGRSQHASGTGPDSVYFHAVRPGRAPADGPRAVCGYPLRRRVDDLHADDRSFEDRWAARDDCCLDCGAALGLSEVEQPVAEEPSAGRNWVLIGAVAMLLPMLVGVLARVMLLALR